MMEDNAPAYDKMTLVKTYQNVLLVKRTVAAELFGETY